MTLIAYYPLDRDVKDYSGNGRDGVNSGVTFVDGQVNNAGDFEEISNDYIGVTTPSVDFTNDDEFTLTAWINLDDNFIDQGGNNVPCGVITHLIGLERYGIQIFNPDTTPTLEVGVRSSAGFTVDGNYSLNYNTWYFIVAIFTNNNIDLYVNGSFVTSFSHSINFDTTGGTMEIGSDLVVQGGTVGTSTHYDGQIDDVRIYDHVLSAAEISDLYNMNSNIATQIQGVVHTSKFNGGEFSDVDHSYRINYADLVFIDNSTNDLVTQLNATGNKRLEIFSNGVSVYTGIVEDWNPIENNQVSLYSIDYAILLLGEYIPSYDCNGQTASTIITDIISTYDIDSVFTTSITSTTTVYNDVFTFMTPLEIMAELALRENFSLRLSPTLVWTFQGRDVNDLGITYTEGEDFIDPDFPKIRHKIKNNFYAVDQNGNPFLKPDLTSQSNNYARPSMTDLPDATTTGEVRDYLNARARRNSDEIIPGSIKIPQNFSVIGTGLVRINYSQLSWTNRLLYTHAVTHSLTSPFSRIELVTYEPEFDEEISDLLIESRQLKKRNITGTLTILPDLFFEIAMEVTVTVERQDTSNFTWNDSGQDDGAQWNSTPTAWTEIVSETTMEVMNRFRNRMRDLLQGEAVTALDADNAYIELGSGTTSVMVTDTALTTPIAGTDGDMDATYPRDGNSGEAVHQTSYSDSDVVSFTAQEIALLENNNLMARVVLDNTFSKSEDQNIRVTTTTKFTDADPTEIMTAFLNRVRDQLQGKTVTDADSANSIIKYGSGTTAVTASDTDLDTPIAGTSQGMEAGYPKDGVVIGQAWFESLIEDADVVSFEAREAGFFIDTVLMARVVFPAKLKKLSGSDVITRAQITFQQKV